MSLLRARDLSVIPPGSTRPVVEKLSLSLSAGEWLAVTGGNGGGKTSLLLGLAGLWPITGELAFEGVPFPREDRSRANVSVVLQDPSSQILQPTVREELAFGLRNRGLAADEIDARVRAWGREFELDRDLDADPTSLSAGWQQTVLIAAALAGEPRLLLADEPTAHLDSRARRRVLDAVRRRAAEGMAVVWVTQLSDELALADRTLEIGSRSIPQPGEPPPAPNGTVSLRIRVSPTTGDAGDGKGPRISIDAPIEVSVHGRGVTGIVGRNGIGKSALLGAVAGHTPIDQVHISWMVAPEPRPITTLQYPELQIFEESPAAEVVYAAVARGVPRDEALGIAWKHLETLGMSREAMSGRRTWSLSTGEKRMLEVVAALIAPACLYVLDEPSAGLDPARKAMLGRLIAERAEASPVLIATQDHDWLRALGASVVDLDSG